jgi:hypothetical protein
MKKRIFFSTLVILFSVHSFSQQNNLPEILTSASGKKIASVKQWEKVRRPEIQSQVEFEMYGKVPANLKIDEVVVLDQDDQALNGKAIRKQVRLTFRGNQKELSVEMLMYLPKGIKSYPTFLGYNFGGNQTIYSDTAIHIAKEWNGAARPRGVETVNWEVEKLINAGCGVATMYYWDIAPDREDFSIGIYPLLYKNGQTQPASDEWGSLAAWAWGLSRALDYLKTDKQVDGNKVIVLGHSRLGKASLWAGALDQRFAAVISNNSGCGGASIYRGKAGETLLKMNNRFPRWTAKNFKKYTDHEDQLPFDQHMVLAMVAPRPLYVASASEDAWADPKNEYKSAFLATSVYHLYGLKGIESAVFPALNTPVGATVSYHIRNGKHDILAYDWDQYIAFAKKYVMTRLK